MNAAIPDHLLQALRQFVCEHMGLSFPPDRWNDLRRGILAASGDFGFNDPAKCIEWLVAAPLSKNQIDVLAGHLTIGETYFFRDRPVFDLLEHQLLPELIRTRRAEGRRLRIWSAACCTGEEPYSLAILLRRLLPDIADWHLTLLATDINPHFLKKAAQGVYGRWSFRGVEAGVKERFFRALEDEHHELLPEIRKLVTLAPFNLAQDAYPSLVNNTNAMDMIVCRNVLIYFEPELIRAIVAKFYRSLTDGGWLVVSASEASHELFADFITVTYPGAILYRKPFPGEKKQRHTTQEVPQPSPLQRWEEQHQAPGHPVTPVPSAPAELRVVEVPAESGAVPDPAELYDEAQRCYEQGRFAQAETVLAKLLELLPEDARVLALASRVCANEGKLVEALTWCERALARDRFHASHHYLHASILQEQGTWDDAMASLRRAIYLDPDFVLAHFAMGNFALRRGSLAEAGRHLAVAQNLLQKMDTRETLPESDGLTVGRLSEIITSML